MDITPAEKFLEMLAEAELSVGEFASLTGIDQRTVKRWIKGDVEVTSWVWTWLDMAARLRGIKGLAVREGRP